MLPTIRWLRRGPILRIPRQRGSVVLIQVQHVLFNGIVIVVLLLNIRVIYSVLEFIPFELSFPLCIQRCRHHQHSHHRPSLSFLPPLLISMAVTLAMILAPMEVSSCCTGLKSCCTLGVTLTTDTYMDWYLSLGGPATFGLGFPQGAFRIALLYGFFAMVVVSFFFCLVFSGSSFVGFPFHFKHGFSHHVLLLGHSFPQPAHFKGTR